MKTSTRFLTIAILMLAPAMASAQGFKDLDGALSAVSRGFQRGETKPIVDAISNGDQVNLQFPGLVDESGYFGKDQAMYLLDELFKKANPSDFQQVSARKVSAQNQYMISAKWEIKPGDKPEQRFLYITLSQKNDRWAIVSARSSTD